MKRKKIDNIKNKSAGVFFILMGIIFALFLVNNFILAGILYVILALIPATIIIIVGTFIYYGKLWAKIVGIVIIGIITISMVNNSPFNDIKSTILTLIYFIGLILMIISFINKKNKN